MERCGPSNAGVPYAVCLKEAASTNRCVNPALLFPSHRERREQVQVNRPAHRQIADAVRMDLIAGSAGRAFGNEFGDRTTLWARACFCVEPAETLGRASFPRAGPLYLVPTLVK